ncbi:PD-(D/E)XK nuclease family protein [Mesobacillus jeotgali]|uniref:PD-(D/E)XK nuclease family protein n=1 Tax=Mesobacillus jeotgali TaxID=129985 RepID=UPI001CFF198D|nr:PD-(D/E)XK nuclease family protein [Mesobacillus jeotgali]
MSAFERLFYLLKNSTTTPWEDYLTEVVAPVFQKKEILISFLYKCTGVKLNDVSGIKVNTQKTYTQLPGHSTDSRPDLIISFQHNKKRHHIFIENKLGSGEGMQQLQRYFDHLQEHQKKGYSTYLIYVTKHYDPKEKAAFSHKGTIFCQLQWYQIYQLLRAFEDDLYVKEVTTYMEEINLNESRRFTPTDITALQNLKRLQSMLDQTLDGKHKESFEGFFGKSMQWLNRANQLRSDNRYVLYNDQSDWKFIGSGFWFTDEEYPTLTVFLEVHPNCNHKEELIKAIRNFQTIHPDWEFDEPSDEKDWMLLYHDISLLNLLSSVDHIDNIQEHLINKMRILFDLKENNSELGWLK